MTVPEPYASRLNAVRREMKRHGQSALLITRPESRYYLSGYRAADGQIDETSGWLFITPRKQYLLTDFRYIIQARKEAAGYEHICIAASLIRETARLARRHKARAVGFESDMLSVRTHDLFREEMDGAELLPAEKIVSGLRARKDDAEIRLITRALRITESAVQRTADFIRPGRTEAETARYLEGVMTEMGAEGPAFSTIVASGPNAALPHAEPGPRRIRSGETVVIDCGARYKGYCSDMTRTIVPGRAPSWIKEIYSVVRRAQKEAVAGLRTGMMADEADALARDVIDQAGYGPAFGHSLGHGVGLATHEAPSLSRLRPTRLETGMVVTVEPGIYLEGRGGVRLEEMVVLGPGKARLLNRLSLFYDWD